MLQGFWIDVRNDFSKLLSDTKLPKYRPQDIPVVLYIAGYGTEVIQRLPNVVAQQIAAEALQKPMLHLGNFQQRLFKRRFVTLVADYGAGIALQRTYLRKQFTF